MAKKGERITIRCYGYQKADKWIGVCLNFNLALEANTLEELKKEMNKRIDSYIESVKDTEDKKSIPRLLNRHAPVQDWVFFYYIKLIKYIGRNFPGKFTFQKAIPSPIRS